MLMPHCIAVIPGVLTPDEATATYQGLLDALEMTFSDMFMHDRPEDAMLLQTHGLGWCQAAVDVLQHPSVARAALRAALRAASAQSALRAEEPTACRSLSSADGVSISLNTPDASTRLMRAGASTARVKNSCTGTTVFRIRSTACRAS